MTLVFATNNENKVKEAKKILAYDNILMPKDLDIEFDVLEDGATLKENAYKKAKALYDILKTNVFSDDTGLFVKALDNRPGVHSHRYAGDKASDKDNRNKLLSELSNASNRDAFFKTVICFIDVSGKDHYFEGRLDGKISYEDKGESGFGYDKIFYLENFNKTLGQLGLDKKNELSHRHEAMKKFKEYLDNIYESTNN